MKDYGAYGAYCPHHLKKCVEYTDVSAYLMTELNASQRDVFYRWLEDERKHLSHKLAMLKAAYPGEGMSFPDLDDIEIVQAKIQTWKSKEAENSKVEKFKKSKKENQKNGVKGGNAKLQKGYKEFVSFITKRSINIKDFEDLSNENFKIVLQDKGLTLAPKTADKYRKMYLSKSKLGK